MDADVQQEIAVRVQEAVAASQTTLLSQMESLITSNLSSFQQQIASQQKELADTQLNKIQGRILATDTYKFNKRSCEDQYKFNANVVEKVQEAVFHLNKEQPTQADVDSAAANLQQGNVLLQHRQKIIKLADSSELGWKLFQNMNQIHWQMMPRMKNVFIRHMVRHFGTTSETD